MEDDEIRVIKAGPEYSEPAYISDIINSIEPVIDTVLSLTKAVMEMSVAGRYSQDEKFRAASVRAFKQVGDAIEGLKSVRFEMDLLKSQPPEGIKDESPTE